MPSLHKQVPWESVLADDKGNKMRTRRGSKNVYILTIRHHLCRGELLKAKVKICSLGYWGGVQGIKIEQKLSITHTLSLRKCVNPIDHEL